MEKPGIERKNTVDRKTRLRSNTWTWEVWRKGPEPRKLKEDTRTLGVSTSGEFCEILGRLRMAQAKEEGGIMDIWGL